MCRFILIQSIQKQLSNPQPTSLARWLHSEAWIFIPAPLPTLSVPRRLTFYEPNNGLPWPLTSSWVWPVRVPAGQRRVRREDDQGFLSGGPGIDSVCVSLGRPQLLLIALSIATGIAFSCLWELLFLLVPSVLAVIKDSLLYLSRVLQHDLLVSLNPELSFAHCPSLNPPQLPCLSIFCICC